MHGTTLFHNVFKGHGSDQNLSLFLIERERERVYCYNETKQPLYFGASKATLIGVEGDVVGCGGDHYASAPSTLTLKGCLVTTMEIDFHV